MTTSHPERRRRGLMWNWPRRALVIAGGVMAALGLVAGFANRQLLDGPTFAAHVEALVRVGGMLLLVAVGDLRGLAAAHPPRVAKAPVGQPSVRRGVRIALSTAAIVLAGAWVFVLARPGHRVDAVGGAVHGEGLVCNGHAELCDRREVLPVRVNWQHRS
ncbi:MAG: hypothetical protein QM733_13540 [Ilumatobacteraceae bacterium]